MNNNQNYTKTFSVVQSPAVVFSAINNVRGWWSEEIDGSTDTLGEVFDYHFKDIHRCQLKVIELNPHKKVVWHVLKNYFSFTKDKTEWTDTQISFEISKVGDKTEVTFTHIGLVPEYECYDVCSDGWSTYLASLRQLIATGEGNPNVGEAITDSEKELEN